MGSRQWARLHLRLGAYAPACGFSLWHDWPIVTLAARHARQPAPRSSRRTLDRWEDRPDAATARQTSTRQWRTGGIDASRAPHPADRARLDRPRRRVLPPWARCGRTVGPAAMRRRRTPRCPR
eukprot:scaffold2086_cov133-Isochrysis_galbana.AAC.6